MTPQRRMSDGRWTPRVGEGSRETFGTLRLYPRLVHLLVLKNRGWGWTSSITLSTRLDLLSGRKGSTRSVLPLRPARVSISGVPWSVKPYTSTGSRKEFLFVKRVSIVSEAFQTGVCLGKSK